MTEGHSQSGPSCLLLRFHLLSLPTTQPVLQLDRTINPCPNTSTFVHTSSPHSFCHRLPVCSSLLFQEQRLFPTHPHVPKAQHIEPTAKKHLAGKIISIPELAVDLPVWDTEPEVSGPHADGGEAAGVKCKRVGKQQEMCQEREADWIIKGHILELGFHPEGGQGPLKGFKLGSDKCMFLNIPSFIAREWPGIREVESRTGSLAFQ